MSIVVRHDKGLRFIAQCDGHSVVTGVVEGDHEQNNGMWPGQLFIAALGACIGGYVARFCERHELPYAGMSVVVDYENADSPSRVGAVRAAVELPAPVSSRHRQAILRVAAQCYITQSIDHKMQIEVSLSDPIEQTIE